MKSFAAPSYLALSAACILLWAPASPASQVEAGQPAETSAPGDVPHMPGAAVEPQPASPFSASGSLTLASKYLFQGIDYSNGKPVLNPEIDLSAGPISATVWACHDIDQHVSNEFDFSLLHDWSAKKFSLTTGYTYLRYPHRDGWNPSQEFYFDLSHEGALNPTLSTHYDFDAGTGTYSTLGISHSFEKPVGAISLGANLFYQYRYYEQTGFPACEWNANLSHSFGKISITPSISRFVTWDNGDFPSKVPVKAAWLFSFKVAQDF